MDDPRLSYTPAGDDGVAVLGLDDGKANALDPELFAALDALLAQVEAERPGALVVAGRPGFFSAGLDVKRIPELTGPQLNELARTFARAMLRVFALPVPSVAACAGHAIAGGATLALACDRRVFAEGRFRLQLNEVAVGLPVPSWMAALAAAAAPSGLAAEMVLQARALSPAEAHAAGVVHALVPEGTDPLPAARRQAAALAGLPAGPYAETKRRLREATVREVLARLEAELPAP